MILRTEEADDHEAIADITARAFRGVEHSDGSEPAIIARLREAGALALSLVAIEGGGIVGHIAFSAVTIDGRDAGWFCVLLGEPEYYRWFGFEVDGRLRYEGAPPEYFMSLGLAEGNAPTGKVEYHPAFTGG
jgi:putative acetyltransferase